MEIFVGRYISKLMFDSNFEITMSTQKGAIWISFKEVVNKFLGNVKKRP